MPALERQEVEDLVASVFSDRKVSAVFFRCCTWLLSHRTYLLHEHEHSAGTAEKAAGYTRAYNHFREILDPASRTPEAARDGTLSDGFAAHLTAVLARELKRDAKAEVFPTILALLRAIDSAWGMLISTLFYTQPTGEHQLIPIPLNEAYPRGHAAFGTDRLQSQQRSPRWGYSTAYLELTQYFGLLTIAPPDQPQTPRPGLHATSAQLIQQPVDEGPWRVAMISFLADENDIAWETRALAFWGSHYTPGADAQVRARFRWALTKALQSRPHMVLIPELNLDGSLCEEILKMVSEISPPTDRPHLVIGGRLHTPAPDGSELYQNRPIVITPGGEINWGYSKIEPAPYYSPEEGLSRREALHADEDPWIVGLDTPLGRVAVVTCLDFLQRNVLAALVTMRANLVVVLSMCKCATVDLYRNKASELAAANGAITIMVNSSIHFRGENLSNCDQGELGFIFPSTRKPEVVTHGISDPASRAVVGLYTIEYDLLRGVQITVETREFTEQIKDISAPGSGAER